MKGNSLKSLVFTVQNVFLFTLTINSGNIPKWVRYYDFQIPD